LPLMFHDDCVFSPSFAIIAFTAAAATQADAIWESNIIHASNDRRVGTYLRLGRSAAAAEPEQPPSEKNT
jgi:hypothetical protein